MRQPGSNPFSRRKALQIGGLGMLGVTMPRVIRATEQAVVKSGKAKSVIFLYQFGGPSHLDTFDPKPLAPDGVRSHYGVIDTAAPGIQICDRLPKASTISS